MPRALCFTERPEGLTSQSILQLPLGHEASQICGCLLVELLGLLEIRCNRVTRFENAKFVSSLTCGTNVAGIPACDGGRGVMATYPFDVICGFSVPLDVDEYGVAIPAGTWAVIGPTGMAPAHGRVATPPPQPYVD